MATQIGSLFASIVLSTDGLARDIAKAESHLKKFSGKLEAFANDISLKLSAPMAAFGAVSVKSFAEFEKGMAEVQTIANASTGDFKKLETGVRELSKRIGLDLNDSVKGLYEALSANVPKDNALAFLEVAAKAGKAGVSSTKTAVDGLTSALNAYKIPAEKAGEVSDKFFIAIRNGKTNFEQLAGSIGQVLPTANAFGVSLDEVLASVASLTKQGVKTTESMTQLKAAMVALAKPNKDMAALLEKVGYTSGSAMLQQLGLVNSLELLRAAAGDLDTLTEALGSTEALGAALALTGENAKGFAADLADVRNSAGATDKAFATMDETSASAFAKLRASLTELTILIGEKLVPHLLPLVEKAKGLADAFGQLDAETQSNLVGLGLFAALLGPALVIIAKVGTAVATLVGWMGGLAKIWGAVVAVGGALATMLDVVAAMFGSTVLGVTALGLALGIVLSDMELFQVAGTELGNIIIFLIDSVKAFGEGLISFLQAPIATVQGWIDGLMRSFLQLIGVIDSADDRLRRAQEGEGSIARARRLGLTGLANDMERDIRGARATGGPVQPGGSYLVGEHGPEIFTPSSAGAITGAAATRSAQAAMPAITLNLSAGVPAAVRAEVQAMLPQIQKQIERALLGSAERPGPWGRALRG